MDRGKIFQKWVHHQRQTDIPENFPLRVMTEIHTYGQQRKDSLIPRLLPEKDVFSSPFFRFLLGAGMSALGIFRISYVTLNLLAP